MQAYLQSDQWQRQTRWDHVLYQAVYDSLDLTIDALDRSRVEQMLEKFRRAQAVVHERCESTIKSGCTKDGYRRLPQETNCLFLDSACAYDCIDSVAADLGLSGMNVSGY
mmetsp:Transcript_13807/g.22194  ORF Transcript_13807/g.22194 Transcript_13807/m.22194 type:complete len:110 (+) Transcript_13807:2-331(+)